MEKERLEKWEAERNAEEAAKKSAHMEIWTARLKAEQEKRLVVIPTNFSSPDQYRNERRLHDDLMDRPILIEKVLSKEECERICDDLVCQAGSANIQLQRKKKGETIMHDCTFEQSLDVMISSKLDDSIFCFVEGRLESNEALQPSKQILKNAKESLFEGDDDWFEWFPPEAVPSDCVVIASHGATSTLHRDPFEWTGTSLCLEGRQIWRFLPPPPPDEALRACRLESIAWGQENVEGVDDLVLSAGRQSDNSFFTINKEANGSIMVEPRDLAEMEDLKAFRVVNDLAIDAGSLRHGSLRPNIPGVVGDAFLPMDQLKWSTAMKRLRRQIKANSAREREISSDKSDHEGYVYPSSYINDLFMLDYRSNA
jgi:hypothetical protein